jgi:uncharacterized protein
MQRFVRRFVIGLVPVAAGLVSIPADSADAQSAVVQATQPPPYIAATAVGDSRIVPDRALVSVAVESHAESAAKAGAANAAMQTRVIDAVKATGVAAAQIRTAGYNVFPEYAQSSGKGPRVTSYRAQNTVQVEVREISNIGKVIDAALGAGATNIGGVNMFASNTEPARKEALQKAGSLGALLELTIDPINTPQPMMRVAMLSAMNGAVAAQTPVETGEIVVQAVVRARWQFTPAR